MITGEEKIDHKSKKRKYADSEVNIETFDPSNRAEIKLPQGESNLQNGMKRRKKKSKASKGPNSEELDNTLIRAKKVHKKNSKRRKRTLKKPITAQTK